MSAPLPRERAAGLLERIRGLRLVVVGDLMLDEYLFGDVNRISPEAPVPVVRLRRETCRLGGAGNVAANAAALGARVALVGVVGADAAGERLRAEAAREGIDGTGVVVDAARPTTIKTRVIAHSQQVVRCDREEEGELAGEVEERVVRAYLEALAGAHAVVVSDYAKGTLTRRVLKEVFAAASARALPAVVDPKLRNFDLYQPVTALTPNHHEAGQAAGVFGHDDDAVRRMGAAILEKLEAGCVLITRGEAGMTLFERGGATTAIPAAAREVYDVTGAGDTVSGVFTLVLAARGSAVEAAALASHAAGVVVGKVGAATASPDEILRSLA